MIFLSCSLLDCVDVFFALKKWTVLFLNLAQQPQPQTQQPQKTKKTKYKEEERENGKGRGFEEVEGSEQGRVKKD